MLLSVDTIRQAGTVLRDDEIQRRVGHFFPERSSAERRPTFTSIGAGGNVTCGMYADSTATCWGGSGVERNAPDDDTEGDGTKFDVISIGWNHRCGLWKAHAVCWGSNGEGQLGDGSNREQPVPAPSATSLQLQGISAGGAHTCGLTPRGEAYCWGRNDGGQLGNGLWSASSAPVPVRSTVRFERIRAGREHTCGVSLERDIYCWGNALRVALGNGINQPSSLPVRIAVGGTKFKDVAPGEMHTCALTTSGAAYCWGANGSGQLGDGSKRPRPTPVRVQTTVSFDIIVVGAVHTCGRTDRRATYCWGDNTHGELGDNGRASRERPVEVSGGEVFMTLAAGAHHTCGLTARSQAFCWGSNEQGQLGDGTKQPRRYPYAVRYSSPRR